MAQMSAFQEYENCLLFPKFVPLPGDSDLASVSSILDKCTPLHFNSGPTLFTNILIHMGGQTETDR